MLWWLLEQLGVLIGAVPRRWLLAFGRFVGRMGYHCLPRQRAKVVLNLKTAFAGRMDYDTVNRTAVRCFQHHMVNVLDFIHLTQKDIGRLNDLVRFEGEGTLEEVLGRYPSVILAAMHHGPWELGSLASALKGHPYLVMIREQPHWGVIGEWFDSRRKRWKVQTMNRGRSLKQLLRSIRKGGIVALVVDQGGKNGVDVPFFGREARFARGAVWLALRERVPLMFVTVNREPTDEMSLRFKPVWFPDESSATTEEQVLGRIVREMEAVVSENPDQYFWFYKVWKYALQRSILILHDGRKGHQRQAQTAASWLSETIVRKGWKPLAAKEITLVFRSKLHKALFPWAAAVMWRRASPGRVGWMRAFLKPSCFNDMMAMRADYVVSAAGAAGAAAALVSRDHGAKSLHILKCGPVPLSAHTAVVLPQHDVSSSHRSTGGPHVFITHGALHPVDEGFLRQTKQRFLARYTHFRPKDRLIVGVLIGGPTKGFRLDKAVAERLLRLVEQAADELGADVLITTSRRTPPPVDRLIRAWSKRTKACSVFVSGRNAVPEAVGGILALSDIVVVTADSISMVCEAAGSGKPVVVLTLPKRGLTASKHERFLDHMVQRGFILTAEPAGLGRILTDCVKRKCTTKRLNERQAFLAWAGGWV